METQIVEKAKELWNSWDIRVSVLASLFIQIVLTLLAPFRKSSASSILGFLIWVLYLSADAIAVFVIGLIASNQLASPAKKEILAFWAPFLLLHLGGPDTITALALEDNELWNRHALQLATQSAITVYVFVLSFRYNGLLAPTLLIFCDGMWKYFERTYSLFFASADNFRDSLVAMPEPGPNYARLMEEYVSVKDAHIPADFKDKDGRQLAAGGNSKSEQTDGSNNNNENHYYSAVDADSQAEENMVRKAYEFFDLFKAILADGFLSLKDRKKSRQFFVSSNDGFRIIQIELNLIYDVFYTKSFLLRRRRVFARLACFFAVIMSLFLFCFSDRRKYDKADVIITFVLLGGAIALDMCAAVMLAMSDWLVVISTLDSGFKGYIKSIMLGILKCSRWTRQSHCRRWSRSVSKYNLLRRCFREPPFFFTCFSNLKQIRDVLLGLLYVEQQSVDDKLVEHIIADIKFKASRAMETELAKEVCSARGNLVLHDDYFLASECLSPWTVDVDFDESLLIWHLATDICYWNSIGESSTKERDVSKALSDYMSYLLLRQQTLLSSMIGMSETRFEDTCADAKKFMNHAIIKSTWLKDPWWKLKRLLYCQSWNTSDKDDTPCQREENLLFKEFSKKVLGVKADVHPTIAKGDKSKSVLFDACRLAKQLQMFDDRQWDITSKVWVELLCYAAVRCSPRSHIARLNKGGELVTLVWLFMAHLGLGERFLQNQGFGWTKLIVGK